MTTGTPEGQPPGEAPFVLTEASENYLLLVAEGISTVPGLIAASGNQKSITYRAVDGLEELGVVHRPPDPEQADAPHRRARLVELDPDGVEDVVAYLTAARAALLGRADRITAILERIQPIDEPERE